MRISLAIFVFAIVLSESALADFVQIVARAKPAVVQTAECGQSGTGFFVSSHGYLVTNVHVLAGARNRTSR
jgi:S1-C subfamily serine protease